MFCSPNSRDPLFSLCKQLQQCLSESKQLGTSFFHFQIAGKHFFRAPTGCEPVFLTLNRCHNLFPCSNSCELHFLVSKQQGSTFFILQIAATQARNSQEPIFSISKQLGNIFFLVSKQLLTVVNYIFWSPNSRDPSFFSLQITASVFVRLEIDRNQFFPLPNSWETFFSCSYWL